MGSCVRWKQISEVTKSKSERNRIMQEPQTQAQKHTYLEAFPVTRACMLLSSVTVRFRVATPLLGGTET